MLRTYLKKFLQLQKKFTLHQNLLQKDLVMITFGFIQWLSTPSFISLREELLDLILSVGRTEYIALMQVKHAHEDGTVVFSDGSLVPVDVIVHCTGYVSLASVYKFLIDQSCYSLNR